MSLTTILNNTSSLSFVPLTKVPVNSATKAIFHSFTLSLCLLLNSKNIEVIEVIPSALNNDLGGVGIHDGQATAFDFEDAFFTQLKEGKTELTFSICEVWRKRSRGTSTAFLTN
jgi:uncharacterized oxidoreductase